MSATDRVGFIGLILVVGGFSAMGTTWMLIVPGFIGLGTAAYREHKGRRS